MHVAKGHGLRTVFRRRFDGCGSSAPDCLTRPILSLLGLRLGYGKVDLPYREKEERFRRIRKKA